MSNLLSSFRAALAADLQVRFPDAEVVQGQRAGKASDVPVLALFWAGSAPQSGRIVVGQARFIIRYWPVSARLRDVSPSGVRDPGELEQAAWDLQSFLRTKQQAYLSTGVWFSDTGTVTPDYDPDEWGVEAELLLQFSNPATVTA